MPVAASPRVLRKLRGSVGEMSVMELNNNMWLADTDNRRNNFFLGKHCPVIGPCSSTPSCTLILIVTNDIVATDQNS